MIRPVLSRILGVIVTTFVIALFYGLLLTTEDLFRPHYNPVSSGHRAAENVYGLFGTVSEEIKRNDASEPVRLTSIAHRIAMPYAITADLSAIFGGRIEAGVLDLFNRALGHKARDV